MRVIRVLRKALRRGGSPRLRRDIPRLWRALGQMKELARQRSAMPGRPPVGMRDAQIILGEDTSHTKFDRHYVYHTAWAARVLKKSGVTHHVDISSSLEFVALCSAFVDIEHYDYRPADLDLPGLKVNHGDLMRLPFADNSQQSVSCMHVVEHVGLGRYGDPLDIDGDLAAMRELSRVVAPGGQLLFVVPVGRPCTMFNAHRIYSYSQIIASFPDMHIEEFRFIDDTGGLREPPDPSGLESVAYGCGCFWLKKRV